VKKKKKKNNKIEDPDQIGSDVEVASNVSNQTMKEIEKEIT
jgi:hypothetical protein